MQAPSLAPTKSMSRERVVGLVVAGEDDDAVFLAGVADDEVAHVQQAGGGAGGEAVGLEVALGDLGLEVVLDEGFGLGVAGRADEALGRDVEVLLGEGVDGLSADARRGFLGAGRWRRRGEGQSNGKSEIRGFFAALRMTALVADGDRAVMQGLSSLALRRAGWTKKATPTPTK